jgi:hypothetical protein
MLINIRMSLEAIVSACNLHAIVFIKNYIEIFTWFTTGICRPFIVRKASIGLGRWEK